MLMHFRSNWKLEVLVYEGLWGGGGRMREPEYRRKNLLDKGREITQQDSNKGQHRRKVSALILLHHHASLLSGTCLTTLLHELP